MIFSSRYFLNKDSSDSFTSDPAGFASLSHFDVILNVSSDFQCAFSILDFWFVQSAAGTLDEIASFPATKTSYLRLYYCDYLSAPAATPVSVNRDGEIDVMDLQDWILKAEPRDRTQAYPLLVLAKKMLSNLNSGHYRVISKRLRELEAQIYEMNQHFEGERQRIISVDQELLAALQKIERKRARSKAQKKRLHELSQAQAPPPSAAPASGPDAAAAASALALAEAQLRALRDAADAQRREFESRLEAQRASVAAQLAALREEAQQGARAARALEADRARLAAAAENAYTLEALGRLPPPQFASLATLLLASGSLWAPLGPTQAAAVAASAAGPVRGPLLCGLVGAARAGAGAGDSCVAGAPRAYVHATVEDAGWRRRCPHVVGWAGRRARVRVPQQGPARTGASTGKRLRAPRGRRAACETGRAASTATP
jgi:hypothetical protein